MFELITRIVATLVFFGLGVSELFYFPLTQQRRSLWRSAPGFLVSLAFVLLTVNTLSVYASFMFLNHIVRLSLIFLGAVYLADNVIRLRIRFRLHYDVKRLRAAINPDTDDFDADRLAEILEEIGWARRYSGVGGGYGETGGGGVA
jgi:hypothetical protein